MRRQARSEDVLSILDSEIQSPGILFPDKLSSELLHRPRCGLALGMLVPLRIFDGRGGIHTCIFWGCRDSLGCEDPGIRALEVGMLEY